MRSMGPERPAKRTSALQAATAWGCSSKKGEIVRKVPEDKLVDELVKEVEAL